MPKNPPRDRVDTGDPLDGARLLGEVLQRAHEDVAAAEADAKAKGKKFKRDLKFAIRFAIYMSKGIASALEPAFPGTVGGEKPSRASKGTKRVDGRIACPKRGRPKGLAFSQFLNRLSATYKVRNGQDFRFAGEGAG